MKKLLIIVILLLQFAIPVSAMEFTAPEVTGQAGKYMPDETETFAQGIWSIIKNVISHAQPDLAEAAEVCACILGAVILSSLAQQIPGGTHAPTDLMGVCVIAIVMIGSSNSMIQLAVTTIEEITNYGKLLLPVITAALAAQGGMNTSTALYTGATVFIGIIGAFIGKLLVPLTYIYLCLAIASCAFGGQMLTNLLKGIKWLMTWILKIAVYVFTGYMSITGIVSGSVDASAIKATKIAFSGMLPVVGGIMSDASESVLAGAAVMKNAVGVYGIFAIFSMIFAPFVKIGIHYLLLKLTTGFADMFPDSKAVKLLKEFTTVMGFALGMIGTVSIILLISTVCFMKGVS